MRLNDFRSLILEVAFLLRLGRLIAKYRILVILIGVLLLVPSAIGYLNTRVNYDILYYLPDSIDTMKGQDILLKDFGKGAYALLIVNGCDDAQAADIKKKAEEVDHVQQVLWYDTFIDDSIPQEMLPDKIHKIFHSDKGTMMVVFFDEGTSSDTTMDAITELRKVTGDQCFLSSMSAIVTDTKDMVNRELFWYVLIAVLLSTLVLAITMDSFMAPVLFLVNIGIAIIYNLGTNIMKGEISFITMSLAAVLQLAVTMDYSIFLWNSYKEERSNYDKKEEAMAHAIANTISSVAGSSLTTIAGFIALCFMTFTLGMDLGVVMAKGVVFGVLTCVTLLPAMILCFEKLIVKTKHRPLTIKGEKLASFVIGRYKVFLLLVLLIIPAVYGYQRIKVYYNLDSSLPDYLPSVQANRELEAGYELNTLHMILADEDMKSKDVRKMIDEIEAVDGVEFALAADSILPAQVPEEFLPQSVGSNLKAGGWQLMMISSAYMIASDEVNNQISEIQEIIKQYDDKAMLIGEAPCTKDLITITDHDFKVVSAVSIVAIFFLILIVLRNLLLPVILVLVIELAIYINMSLAFYTGTTLPFIASIVIGTIQLGATVDYAILMTNRYLNERHSGYDKKEAARIALAVCTPSILTSAVGFFASTIGVAVYSDVDLIAALCLLIARGAIISMLLVLFLLPAFYVLLDKPIMKTVLGRKKHDA